MLVWAGLLWPPHAYAAHQALLLQLLCSNLKSYVPEVRCAPAHASAHGSKGQYARMMQP